MRLLVQLQVMGALSGNAQPLVPGSHSNEVLLDPTSRPSSPPAQQQQQQLPCLSDPRMRLARPASGFVGADAQDNSGACIAALVLQPQRLSQLSSAALDAMSASLVSLGPLTVNQPAAAAAPSSDAPAPHASLQKVLLALQQPSSMLVLPFMRVISVHSELMGRAGSRTSAGPSADVNVRVAQAAQGDADDAGISAAVQNSHAERAAAVLRQLLAASPELLEAVVSVATAWKVDTCCSAQLSAEESASLAAVLPAPSPVASGSTAAAHAAASASLPGE